MAAPPRRDESLTAEVLSLRRRDESEALAALQEAQAALSLAIENAEAARALAVRDHDRMQHEERAFAGLSGSLSAASLQAQAERLRQAQIAATRSERARAHAEQSVTQCREELEARRSAFLLRRGQREAAELFAEQQRAILRRARATRLRVLEEEARERFASGKRKRDS